MTFSEILFYVLLIGLTASALWLGLLIAQLWGMVV